MGPVPVDPAEGLMLGIWLVLKWGAGLIGLGLVVLVVVVIARSAFSRESWEKKIKPARRRRGPVSGGKRRRAVGAPIEPGNDELVAAATKALDDLSR